MPKREITRAEILELIDYSKITKRRAETLLKDFAHQHVLRGRGEVLGLLQDVADLTPESVEGMCIMHESCIDGG